MKKIYITLGLILSTIAALSQNKDTQEADKLFARFEYAAAADAYLKIEKKDAYVNRQLAESYYNAYNTGEAAKWYAEATASPQDAETYFRFAQMLKAEGRYEEANVQMKKFSSLAPNDRRAIEFNQDPDYLPKLRQQAKGFEVKKLGINDEKYGSFGPVLTDEGTLYFTSTRNTGRRNYGRNDEPYLDVYQSTYNSDGSLTEPLLVEGINTKWHDGPVSITGDGKTLYFASESFKERRQFERDRKNNLKLSQVYLFVATRDGEKWGNVQAVPFNDKRWSTGNPAVSKDGNTLYFVSNREGSIGGNDIWKVAVKGNNTYGLPENLGSRVNTEGSENFPYIFDDDRLYFASDGRKGLGGYDLFAIDLAKGGDAMNLGLPVNSSKDDISFSFNTGKNIGFFASNRDGFDNLYSAVPLCGVEATVTVRDSRTGKSLGGAKVSLLDQKNNVLESKATGIDGRTSHSIDCNMGYTVQATAEGYEGKTFQIAQTVGGQVMVAADLNPIDVIVHEKEVALNAIYFEFNQSNITREGSFELDKLAEAMKAHPQMEIMVKAHTDSQGSESYNMALSNRRATATVQYVISKGISKARITGKGFGESEQKVNCGADCTDEQHAQNRRSEFIIARQ